MEKPSLLTYTNISDYKKHYEDNYQRAEIFTFDNIRVYFSESKFGHAFYENSNGKKGDKNQFSLERASRMDWIKATLTNSDAKIYKGWNKVSRSYEDTRRASVVYDDFVVVIEFSLKKTGELKGKFVTCYVADNSITKIRSSPEWNYDECIAELEKI
ncbi:hypothetical protein [uncultured Haemophilus sp.]|uniref:hypothetical protein n=1 Tax=uncultured Haemophilus sp. TaxID=237779 RepID=UPI0025DC8126|nr:hypothetical protein [uncultured Haemophilus sp.]